MGLFEKVEEATETLQRKTDKKPQIGLILGSGLGVLAEELVDAETIPYRELPYFPESTVAGHKGQFVIGSLGGIEVIVMQGRFHYYEGYSMEEVTFPVRVMAALGVRQLVITNAAGGVNKDFNPGDLMIIRDHINQLNDNPLIGRNDERFGVRFPDMSEVYDPALRELALGAAEKLEVPVRQGVYVANTGPSYETPAEVRMIRQLGGDAVGMSTVPEAVVGRHQDLRVLGISCISNFAAGILDEPLTHEEVIETTEKVKHHFISLVKEIVEQMGKGDSK